jgi:CheY-like chemotaxis protein
VHADRGQLEQVLMNLAVSRDAMPHGGTLTIPTRGEGERIILVVRDSGGGMPPDVLAHAFEPFYTTKATGTGLGLATVYGIIRQSGGTIGVESEPDQGTCFTIALPRVRPPASSAVAATGTSPAPHALQTVLVVEDQPEVRHISRRTLETHGYRVLDAENGEVAIEVLLAHPGEVDLLLTDVVMPVMSGRQLADAVTSCEPGIRVLFMSGYIDDPIIRDRVLEHDVDFIRKPFMPDDLVSRVEQALAR